MLYEVITDGGPVDIVKNCSNGILVDARKPSEIAAAIKSILVDDSKWDEFSNNGITGVRNHYSWASHCHKMMQHIRELFPNLQTDNIPGEAMSTRFSVRPPFGKRLTSSGYLMITDIDNIV